MDRLTATRVFVEVVERGSQTAAADALEMSRAMVSRYLGELETWVGARLLHRTTRKLSLTGAGELPDAAAEVGVTQAIVLFQIFGPLRRAALGEVRWRGAHHRTTHRQLTGD